MKVEDTVYNVYMTLSCYLYCIPTIWTLHFDGFIINPLKNAQLQSFLFVNLIYNLLEETQENSWQKSHANIRVWEVRNASL